MFPENLDSAAEQLSRKRFKEHAEIAEFKRDLVRNAVNTLIAGVLTVGMLFLILWLLNVI